MTPFPICTAVGNQEGPALYGDTLVWSDSRNAATSGSDIYLYDYSTGTERAICTAPADQLRASIWGTRIVWEDRRTGSSDIRMFDLATGQERAICDAAGNQMFPVIQGDRIVWTDQRDTTAPSDVYAYDLRTGTETAICTAPGEQSRPIVPGDWVAWRDARNSGTTGMDIYAHNLRTHSEVAVCTAPGTQRPGAGRRARAVGGPAQRGGPGQDIDIKSVPSVRRKLIITAPGNQGNMSVWGDRVAFEDQRALVSGARRVPLDLATGVETPVCAGPMNQSVPVICGGTIAWQDSRTAATSGHDIYGADVDVTAPVTTAAGAPPAGPAARSP